MDRHLIFDLGLHHGCDAEFYLNKGFKVIGLEANPAAIRRVRENPVLQAAEAEGRLGILPMALWEKTGETLPFFVNHAHDDWSSLNRELAVKGEMHRAVEEVRVATITLRDMFEKLGVPYYIKCDIEGADVLFARQLVKLDNLPAFVSAEGANPEIQANLLAAGYDRFQIVNQARHQYLAAPNPSREGKFVDAKFTDHMSGLFGLDLPFDKWLRYEEANEWLTTFRRMNKSKYADLNSWVDVHATKKETLAAAGAPASV
jgi:FkbM family methyltransferase